MEKAIIPAERQLTSEERNSRLPAPALAPDVSAPPKALCMSTPIIIEGDCLQYMRAMPGKSVAAIVTSPPPYNLNKRYSLHNDDMGENQYFAWQDAVAKEVTRILQPCGHLFMVMGSNSKRPWRSIDVAAKSMAATWSYRTELCG